MWGLADISVSALATMRSFRTQTCRKTGDCGFSKVSTLLDIKNVALTPVVCTQWGYFQPAPKEGSTIVSRQ